MKFFDSAAAAAAQYGWTALIYAAVKGRADCARLLLDAGADTNAMSKVRARGGAMGGLRGGMMMMLIIKVGCGVGKCAICLSVFIFHNRPFYNMCFARFMRFIGGRVLKYVSFFRYCVCAFARVEMVATGCDRRSMRFTFLFSFFIIVHLFRIGFQLFVRRNASIRR